MWPYANGIHIYRTITMFICTPYLYLERVPPPAPLVLINLKLFVSYLFPYASQFQFALRSFSFCRAFSCNYLKWKFIGARWSIYEERLGRGWSWIYALYFLPWFYHRFIQVMRMIACISSLNYHSNGKQQINKDFTEKKNLNKELIIISIRGKVNYRKKSTEEEKKLK